MTHNEKTKGRAVASIDGTPSGTAIVIHKDGRLEWVGGVTYPVPERIEFVEVLVPIPGETAANHRIAEYKRSPIPVYWSAE